MVWTILCLIVLNVATLNLKALWYQLDKINLATFEIEQFFELCKILYNVEFGDFTILEKIEMYSKFVKYPAILKKEHLGFVELNILTKIVQYEIKINKLGSTNYLYDIYKNGAFYISSNNKFIVPALLVNLSRIFGSMNELEKSLDIANQGIKYSLKNFDSKVLPNLYYLSALCEYKLGMRRDFETNLVKCLATTVSNQNNEDFKYYKNLMKNVFSIDENNLMYLLSVNIKKMGHV